MQVERVRVWRKANRHYWKRVFRRLCSSKLRYKIS